MVLDKFNMVDMEGIDLILDQDNEIPGLYQKLVESMAQCRYQCLYNWKSDGVNIPPTYIELVVDPNSGNVLINSGVYVTSEDVLTTTTGGERLPTGISFVGFSKPATNVFTVAHGLGEAPDMVMIFQESYDAANGNNSTNPLLLFANPANPSASGYTGKLVCNYVLANGNWDYQANASFGWSADATYVEIKCGNTSPPFPDSANTWYMLSVKFKDD